jgi:hypothetical protein
MGLGFDFSCKINAVAPLLSAHAPHSTPRVEHDEEIDASPTHLCPKSTGILRKIVRHFAVKVMSFCPAPKHHTFSSRIVLLMVTISNTILEEEVWTFFFEKCPVSGTKKRPHFQSQMIPKFLQTLPKPHDTRPRDRQNLLPANTRLPVRGMFRTRTKHTAPELLRPELCAARARPLAARGPGAALGNATQNKIRVKKMARVPSCLRHRLGHFFPYIFWLSMLDRVKDALFSVFRNPIGLKMHFFQFSEIPSG